MRVQYPIHVHLMRHRHQSGPGSVLDELGHGATGWEGSTAPDDRRSGRAWPV